MEDIIQDRLSKISNLDDRRLLKSVLYDVFQNVVDYNMDMYARLEQRIYDETPDPLHKLYIYTCLAHTSDLDPVSDFLHPMVEEDLENAVYDMEAMNESLKNGENITLASIFMKCDYTALKSILSNKRTFKGFIKTQKNVHQVEVTLKHCQKYVKKIEKLYQIFQANGLIWNTVNCPYAYKFVDVVLNPSVELSDGESIIEITIDLAEYEKYKEIGVIPLWNIKEISVSDKAFPMPAKDRINYDHVISLNQYGTQNGYLVGLDNSDFIYCKRLEEDLVIVSSKFDERDWRFIKVENAENSRQTFFEYELMSNKRDLGFIGRYSGVKSLIIRTRAEIARFLQSYELSQALLFQSVDIVESYDKPKNTVNFNRFIDDEIRVDSYKKIMLIKFKPLDRDNYLIQDKMSFLTSEIQILFPEYKCIGEFV